MLRRIIQANWRGNYALLFHHQCLYTALQNHYNNQGLLLSLFSAEVSFLKNRSRLAATQIRQIYKEWHFVFLNSHDDRDRNHSVTITKLDKMTGTTSGKREAMSITNSKLDQHLDIIFFTSWSLFFRTDWTNFLYPQYNMDNSTLPFFKHTKSRQISFRRAWRNSLWKSMNS